LQWQTFYRPSAENAARYGCQEISEGEEMGEMIQDLRFN